MDQPNSIESLTCARHTLALSRPQVMGVLNVTPDSFSDGGRFFDAHRALDQAYAMVEAGAAIIDIGGESTRPGAEPVAEAEELRRIVPLVDALASKLPVPISVDTSKPLVMREAIAAGAGMINDVYALRQNGALEAVAATDGVALCLMHMLGEPRTMQQQPHYADVVEDVRAFLAQRVAACEQAGIKRTRMVLDPGFGFGKSAEHNLCLLKRLDALSVLGLPLLAGLSRKSMLGRILGDRPVEGRLHASVAAAVLAAAGGARIIRAHDVAATVDALAVVAAVEAGRLV